MVELFCRSWSTCVKLTHNCPRSTKTWIVENLLAQNFIPVKTELMARYANFYKSLKASNSYEVSFLAEVVSEDVRSTTARNLNLIRVETDTDPLTTGANTVRKAVKKTEIPDGQSWRIDTLDFLLKERRRREARLEKVDQLSSIIDALCSV